MENLFSPFNCPRNATLAPQPGSSVSPLILIIEDHEDTRLLYRFVMENNGFRVIEAADGEQGILIAQKARPDLILMDTNLPRVDGFMAALRLRSTESLRDVPIIFMSSHGQPEVRLAALASGGNEYLLKPIELSDLELAVMKHLKKPKKIAVEIH
jgi:two-component system phosphate regulon response regulator PhoB